MQSPTILAAKESAGNGGGVSQSGSVILWTRNVTSVFCSTFFKEVLVVAAVELKRYSSCVIGVSWLGCFLHPICFSIRFSICFAICFSHALLSLHVFCHLLSASHCFPYVKKRILVVYHNKEEVLSPIQVATDEMAAKVTELQAVVSQAIPDVKKLQLKLQGAVSVQVGRFAARRECRNFCQKFPPTGSPPLQTAAVTKRSLRSSLYASARLHVKISPCYKHFGYMLLVFVVVRCNHCLVGPGRSMQVLWPMQKHFWQSQRSVNTSERRQTTSRVFSGWGSNI